MLRMKLKSFWNGDAFKEKVERISYAGAKACAEYVAKQAIMYAPEDTGDLKRSIKVVPTMAGARWHVVADIPYAGYVEYGTLHGNTWIAPRPFMRRALADGKRMYPEIMKNAMATTPHQLEMGMKMGISFSTAA